MQYEITSKTSIIEYLRKYKTPLLFVSPFFILFLIFSIFPICYTIYLSFFKWHSTKKWIFIGFKNYIDLFKDPIMWKTVINVIYIFIVNVPIMVILAIALASLLNSNKLRFKNFFRIAYLLPYVTSLVAVSIVFYIFFDSTGNGLLNSFLSNFNIKPIEWLVSSKYSKLSIVIMATWRWTGYNMIIVIGGLQSIEPQIYDAAKIDGSSIIRTFLQITIPLLRPIIFFIVMMCTIGTFNMFTEPYMLTQGGPAYSSMTMVMYMYITSFKYFNLGYGAAMSILIFIFVLVPSYLQLKQMKKGEQV